MYNAAEQFTASSNVDRGRVIAAAAVVAEGGKKETGRGQRK